MVTSGRMRSWNSIKDDEIQTQKGSNERFFFLFFFDTDMYTDIFDMPQIFGEIPFVTEAAKRHLNNING